MPAQLTRPHLTNPSASRRPPGISPASGAWLVAIALGLASAGPVRAQGPTHRGFQLNSSAVSGQHLAVADKSGLQGNGEYTLEAWVRPVSYAGFPCIVGNDFSQSFWLGLNTSGRLRFYPRGGFGQYVEGTAIVPLAKWTHVAATYRSAVGWALYVDGVLDNSGNSITGAPGTSADSLCIGADRVGGVASTFWRGRLDQVRIWSRAISGTEVRYNRFTGVGLFGNRSAYYAGLEGSWSVTSGAAPTTTVEDGMWAVGSGATVVKANDAFIDGNANDILQADFSIAPVPLDHNVALDLNGIDDYAWVLSHSTGYGGGLTIEAWVHPYSFANYPTIAGRHFLASFWFGLTPEGRLRFYPRGGSAVDGGASVPLDRWTHVAATYDPVAGSTRLYVNGELDHQSSAITGPVGENGRSIFVGADNSPSVPNYFFRGMLDEVNITNGPLSQAQVRARRFFGNEPFTNSFGNDVVDVNGVTRRTYRVHCGPYTYWVRTPYQRAFPEAGVEGTQARLVTSGAPMFSAYSGTSFATDAFALAPPGERGLVAPDLLTLTNVSIPIDVNSSGYLTDVDVFLSLSSEDLSRTTCTVRSPSGTDVTLLAPGVLEGRSLQTVFDDESANTPATWGAPCEVGDTQPSSPLHAVDLEPAGGTWTVSVQTSGGAHFAVWAAGVRVSGAPMAVGDGDAPGRVVLAHAGAEPVRGLGAVRFTLPHEAQVRLALYDVAGREVRALHRGTRAAGEYRVSWNAAGLAPGRYVMALDVADGPRCTLPVTVLR